MDWARPLVVPISPSCKGGESCRAAVVIPLACFGESVMENAVVCTARMKPKQWNYHGTAARGGGWVADTLLLNPPPRGGGGQHGRSS